MCSGATPGASTGGFLTGGKGIPDPLGIAGYDNGALDPLNLAAVNRPGGYNYKQKNPTLVGPENPPDAISAETLNEIQYNQDLVKQRLLTTGGQQSTILTSPTGLTGGLLSPGQGKAGVAPARTLLGG